MDHFRRLIFCVLALFSASSFAGSAAVMTATASAVSTATGIRAVTGSFSATAGSFNIPSVVQVAGRSITMPASARIASNAPSYVLSGIRSKNLWVAGGAIALWLGQEAIQQQAGQWVKTSYAGYVDLPGGIRVTGPVGSLPDLVWQARGSWVMTVPISAGAICDVVGARPSLGAGGHYAMLFSCAGVQYVLITDAGNTFRSWPIVLNGTLSSPATNSDFDAVLNHPMPDAAAVEAAANNVPVPVDEPQVKPGVVTAPITDPYTDPVTGKTVQDKVQVNPDPVPGNPMQVRVTPFTTETQPDGSTQNKSADLPTGGGGTSSGGTPTDTDCDKYPNASGCQPFDDVPDSNLGTKDIQAGITPYSGFGPDNGSCPADVPIRNGAVFSFVTYCDLAYRIRPILLGAAWVVAVLLATSGIRAGG